MLSFSFSISKRGTNREERYFMAKNFMIEDLRSVKMHIGAIP